jgi:hypothetical protein
MAAAGLLIGAIIWFAVLSIWVASFRSGHDECFGIALPREGEADLAFSQGDFAIVWGPPAERFLGAPQIDGVPAPQTWSARRVPTWPVTLTARRSGVVRGVGPWLVQILARSNPLSIPPVPPVTRKVVASHLPEPAVIDTVLQWERWGFVRKTGLIVYVSDWNAVVCGEELWVPRWFVAVVFFIAAFPLGKRGLRLLRTVFRRRTGRCVHCGYDLRTSPERCPECGANCKTGAAAGLSPVAGD